jgi:hypothetical protein
MEQAIEDIAFKADELYDNRADLEKVRASVVRLYDAAAAVPFDLQWRLSRAHFFLGQESKDDAERCQQHRAGAVAGRKAVGAEPAKVEGQFWLGVNLALEAALVTPWRAVALALHAKRSLQRAIELDSTYHGAGPHRVLARLCSRMPEVLGGGAKRARRHFETAIEIDPVNTVTRIYFAEFLRGLGQLEAARTHLQSVIDAPADERWSFEQARDRTIAASLLAADAK